MSDQISGPQDDDPPQVALVIAAALAMREIVNDPERSSSDLVKSIDALGRALARLKAYVRTLDR